MSARKGKNGFVRDRIVSSDCRRRNNRDGKSNDFNEGEIEGFQGRNSSALVERTLEKPRLFYLSPQGRGSNKRLRLVAGRREQVTAAADGADDGGLGRIDLDLAPYPHDTKVDGAVESFGVARIGEFKQPFA